MVSVGPVISDETRATLYARHATERGLSTDASPDAASYAAHFLDSCTDSREFRYTVSDRIVAISIVDVGAAAASSVYHYFDPGESARSLGVFSVLKEIEWAAAHGLEWYYLGFWVAACRHLAYKADYWPHETLEGGVWSPHERPSG